MPSASSNRAAAKKTTSKQRTVKRKTSKRSPGSTAGKLRVRQVRSGIGYARRFRRTLEALGLKHRQAEVIVPDNPSIRGMLRQVHHLVSVTPEEA